MIVPDWWQFILLALVSYRLWRLIAQDDITDGPRHWVLGLPWNWKEGQPLPKGYREKLALFFNCPWCAGAWISGLVYLVWLFVFGDPEFTDEAVLGGLGTWFALSASVGLIRGNLDPPEEE